MNEQSLGAIYVDVGANLAPLRADLAEARRMAAQTESSTRINIGARATSDNPGPRGYSAGASRAGVPYDAPKAQGEPIGVELARMQKMRNMEAQVERATTRALQRAEAAALAEEQFNTKKAEAFTRRMGILTAQSYQWNNLSNIEEAETDLGGGGGGGRAGYAGYLAGRMMVPGRGGVLAGALLRGMPLGATGADLAMGALPFAIPAAAAAIPLVAAMTSGNGGIIAASMGSQQDYLRASMTEGWGNRFAGYFGSFQTSVAATYGDPEVAKQRYLNSPQGQLMMAQGQLGALQADLATSNDPLATSLKASQEGDVASLKGLHDPFQRQISAAAIAHHYALQGIELEQQGLQTGLATAITNSAESTKLDKRYGITRDRYGNVTGYSGSLDEYNWELRKLGDHDPGIRTALDKLDNFNQTKSQRQAAADATQSAAQSDTLFAQGNAIASNRFGTQSINQKVRGDLLQSEISAVNASFTPVFDGKGKLVTIMGVDASSDYGKSIAAKWQATLNQANDNFLLDVHRGAATSRGSLLSGQGFRGAGLAATIQGQYFLQGNLINGVDVNSQMGQVLLAQRNAAMVAGTNSINQQTDIANGQVSSLFQTLQGRPLAARQAEIIAQGAAEREGLLPWSLDFWRSAGKQMLQGMIARRDWNFTSQGMAWSASAQTGSLQAQASLHPQQAQVIGTIGAMMSGLYGQPDATLRQQMAGQDIQYLRATQSFLLRPQGYATAWNPEFEAKGGPLGNDNDLSDALRMLANAISQLTEVQHGGALPTAAQPY